MFELSVIKAAEKEIMKLPAGLKAEMLTGLETLRKYGAFLKEPVVRDLHRDGLKELRIRSHEGCARGVFFFYWGNHIIIVHVFQKKTQKTPKQVLELAHERMKEVIRRLK